MAGMLGAPAQPNELDLFVSRGRESAALKAGHTSRLLRLLFRESSSHLPLSHSTSPSHSGAALKTMKHSVDSKTGRLF